jgi:DNA-binding MarR family transcriptional regulator
MKFSEEIKSTKFESEAQKAVLNVMFTGNYYSANGGKFFKKHDLSTEQYNVLRILRGSNPTKLCLKDITSRMLDKNSNTSRIVKKLETKKLIDITGHETDKRFYQIGISKKGLDLLAKIDIEFKNNPPHKAFLSESEAKKLNDLLDKMRG